MTAYEFHNNIACVRSKWLTKVFGMPVGTYRTLTQRNWLEIVQKGGNGRRSLIKFDTIREDIKSEIVEVAGNPYKVARKSELQDLVLPDVQAAAFFNEYRKDDESALSDDLRNKYTTNACIYNAIGTLLKKELQLARGHNKKAKTKIWKNIAHAVNTLEGFTHSVPSNARVIQRNFEDYIKNGYGCLIHGNQGNKNSIKIEGDNADWLLAKYCLPIKYTIPELWRIYEVERKVNRWPEVTETAIHVFLNKPEVRRIWFLARHDKETYKNEYGYFVKRKKDNWFPNAYWSIDGTKFDVQYIDTVTVTDKNTGKQKQVTKAVARLRIDPVIDIHSEKIIGYSISETEDHTDHFRALKMAVNTAGCRPLLFTYDNQSGHKSKRMQELYTAVVAKNKGIHYAHRAYRHSSPAEGIFARLQQQRVGKLWFSDKQSPTSRKKDSKPNMDFLKEYEHMLPTREEAIKAWEMIVYQWNNSAHPKHTDKTRNEVYNEPMPEGTREEIGILDRIEIFGINTPKPITYGPGGLLMRLKGQEYWYEVRDENNLLDKHFRKYNIGNKFVVRYDPEFMDEYVQLYRLNEDDSMTYITDATPKREHEVIPALKPKGSHELFLDDFGVVDEEYEETFKAWKDLERRTGITREAVIEEQNLLIKMGGKLPKEQRNEVEANEYDINNSLDRL